MINNSIASTLLAFAVSVGFVQVCFADDAPATDHVKLARLLEEGNGSLVIPAGTYEFGGTLEIDLTSHRATSIQAGGPVTILMKAPGPAIRVTGTLNSSADPQGISDDTWLERMPLIDGIGILGAHEEADGIELVQTMQAVVSRVHIRKVRNAITLSQRNRNVIISNVHVYHNSGIGLLLNEVNLHQINVANSHISYNREGGIVVRGGNVRNLHVTGCDIEANMPNDTTPTESGNVFIDCRESGSVAEVAITGNTIQHYAHYAPEKQAPGGANIRIVGREDFQPNMITITGNVMSDTHTHLHLKKVVDTTVLGNTFFTTEPTDILVEECARIALANNVLNPRESSGTGQVVIRNSSNCTLLGLICHNLQASEAAITLQNCQATRVSQCIVSGSPNGVKLDACTNCSVTDCTITGLPAGGNAVIGDVTGNEVDDVTAVHLAE